MNSKIEIFAMNDFSNHPQFQPSVTTSVPTVDYRVNTVTAIPIATYGRTSATSISSNNNNSNTSSAISSVPVAMINSPQFAAAAAAAAMQQQQQQQSQQQSQQQFATGNFVTFASSPPPPSSSHSTYGSNNNNNNNSNIINSATIDCLQKEIGRLRKRNAELEADVCKLRSLYSECNYQAMSSGVKLREQSEQHRKERADNERAYRELKAKYDEKFAIFRTPNQSDERSLGCDECKFEVKSQVALFIHKLNHHFGSSIPRHLQLSTRSFTTMPDDSIRFKYRCHRCEIDAERDFERHEIYAHIYQFHTFDIPFKCKICFLYFTSKSYLNDHLVEKHAAGGGGAGGARGAHAKNGKSSARNKSANNNNNQNNNNQNNQNNHNNSSIQLAGISGSINLVHDHNYHNDDDEDEEDDAEDVNNNNNNNNNKSVSNTSICNSRFESPPSSSSSKRFKLTASTPIPLDQKNDRNLNSNESSTSAASSASRHLNQLFTRFASEMKDHHTQPQQQQQQQSPVNQSNKSFGDDQQQKPNHNRHRKSTTSTIDPQNSTSSCNNNNNNNTSSSSSSSSNSSSSITTTIEEISSDHHHHHHNNHHNLHNNTNNYNFDNNENLQQIMNDLDGDDNLNCKYPGCQFVATTKSHLKFHISAHLMSKFKCPYCTFVGNRVIEIKRHILKSTKHTDQHVYLCPDCDFASDCEKTFRDHYVLCHDSAVDLSSVIEQMFANEGCKIAQNMLSTFHKSTS